MVNITSTGVWTDIDVRANHFFDITLSQQLLAFLKKEAARRVVDLGCGMGEYVAMLNANGVSVDGFDGNPNTPALTNNICNVLDLSSPIVLPTQYDWVISLEVGEHLPNEFEDIFIQNLHVHNKNGIILSWAVKGQGGDGHYNEQNNDYIKAKVMALGYTNDIEAENSMRAAAELWWFRNTIMVFRKL